MRELSIWCTAVVLAGGPPPSARCHQLQLLQRAPTAGPDAAGAAALTGGAGGQAVEFVHAETICTVLLVDEQAIAAAYQTFAGCTR